MPARDVAVQWQVATDDAFANVVRSGTVAALARARALRARRRDRAPARQRVLLPLHLRRRGQPAGPHEDGAGARRPRVRAALRVRVLPGVAGRLLLRVQAHARGGPRPRRPPRRLHLRVRHLREPPRSRPAGHAARGVPDARALSAAVRALQERPRPAGRPRAVPLGGDVGRPRGRERLRGRPPGVPQRQQRLRAPAGGRLPGVLRAPAAARRRQARRERRHAALPPPDLRRHRRVQRARHAPVPLRPAVRRRRDAALRRPASTRT